MLSTKDIKDIKGVVDLSLESVKKDITEIKQVLKVVKSDVTDVKSTLNEMTTAVGNIFQWTDDIHNSLVKKKLPQRVEKIEKHLGIPSYLD